MIDVPSPIDLRLLSDAIEWEAIAFAGWHGAASGKLIFSRRFISLAATEFKNLTFVLEDNIISSKIFLSSALCN